MRSTMKTPRPSFIPHTAIVSCHPATQPRRRMHYAMGSTFNGTRKTLCLLIGSDG